MQDRDSVQEIKDKLSIIDVVQPYVKLVRAGKYWKGLSPFNKEKTPSFFVSPERGSYYCFSSGQGGDIFTFIEKMEGVDFKGALTILADKAGVTIHAYSGNVDHSINERIREVNAHAAQFFTLALTQETQAYQYANKRGLSEKTIRSWELGYAPDNWRTLLEALTAQNFTKDELIRSGLIKEADGKQGTFYDRFRNRLMFPIKDSMGRIVGFTGRALSINESAKYLNSPETLLFKKSEILFGIDYAKEAIRARGYALIVEGQMDVLHCHQAGFTNAIALSGTALSSSHVALIKRYTDNVIFILDADKAGLSATARSAILALSSGIRVKAATLPKGKDPADILSTDSSVFSKYLSSAQSIINFFLSTIANSEQDRHRRIRAAESIVIPLLDAISSPIEKDYFIGIVAQDLGISSEAVRSTLHSRTATPHSAFATNSLKIEHIIDTNHSIIDSRSESLAAIVLNYPDIELAKHIKSEYSRITGKSLSNDVSKRALFEAGIALGEHPDINVADDLIRSFERSILEEQYTEVLAQLRQAQSVGDVNAQKKSEAVCAQLLKRIASCT